jgi:hypothetical protein
MVSADGKALCLYLPLTDKLLSYDVYTALQGKIREFGGTQDWHIAGLPVAEGAIGVEMFSEMVIASPLTMALIFGLLYAMFRRWSLVILPMLIATVTVAATLGAMIALGFPVHILSSMLPIFLMSISICDSIHVLSEFFDVYSVEKGRKESIKEVMGTLFMPMLYTSLTTAAGFFSFVTTDIPPARVFGAFVGVGVMFAWIITILFVPAYIMLLPERTLRTFGLAAHKGDRDSWLTRVLHRVGDIACRRSKAVLNVFAACAVLSIWGCRRSASTTTTPTLQRRPSHPRGGHGAQQAFRGHVYGVAGAGGERRGQVFSVRTCSPTWRPCRPGWRGTDNRQKARRSDIVRKVHRSLSTAGREFPIPSSRGAVSECVMQYQQSTNRTTSGTFVTPGFDAANIFMQFQSGDSTRTGAAVKAIEGYIERKQAARGHVVTGSPACITSITSFRGKCFGDARFLAGSYVIVLVMMIVLFGPSCGIFMHDSPDADDYVHLWRAWVSRPGLRHAVAVLGPSPWASPWISPSIS